MASKDQEKLLVCSFCGKNQTEVRKLIAGPSVFICNECVDLCNDIINEETKQKITNIISKKDYMKKVQKTIKKTKSMKQKMSVRKKQKRVRNKTVKKKTTMRRKK